MDTLQKKLQDLQLRVESAMERLNLRVDEQKLKAIDADMQRPDFWQDPRAAAKVSQEAAGLRSHIELWTHLHKDVVVARELAELGDETLTEDIPANYERLEQQYRAQEFELKLSGQYDRSSAILSIYAGTGGTDAQDWAEMLMRMYLRYAERANWQVDIVDRSDGEEAGIKSVTLEVNGPYAFGKLRSEKGVHRLVRLSPFNSDNLRQTSFALVEVVPQLEHPEEFAIDEKDLRIDVYRSGGHGGQSVNTTDSAVRITHIPTGTVVAIQNERSQLQNKEKAMVILKGRLTALMLEQQQAELSKLKGPVMSAEWGNQIRSYVLHPYSQVKDKRSGYETSQVQDVLDGDIEPLIDAYLTAAIGGESKK